MNRLQRAAVAVWDRLPVPVQNLISNCRPQLGQRLNDLAAGDGQATLDTIVVVLHDHMLGRRAS